MLRVLQGGKARLPIDAFAYLQHLDLNAVGLSQVFGGNDIIRNALADHPAAVENCRFCCGDKGMVGKMGRHDDAESLLGEGAYHPQDPHLVAHVEMGGWLVEDHDPRFLGQGPRDKGELPFAAAEHGAGPLRQVENADRCHCREGNLPVPPGWRGEYGEMGRPAHYHDVLHQERKGRCLVLRDIGNPFGHIGRPHAGNIPLPETDGAVPPLEHIANALEEGGFAGAVGTQQAEHIARSDRKGYLMEDRSVSDSGIAEGKVIYG
ncbi:MAG: hypothetical protein PHH28_05555 [Desulfuromonadaceae bacterium]|nr:hypothetical protein [Desulfuromonadaceae bacterium]